MQREWFNIDRLRLDKFLMLVRKFIGQLFTYLRSHNWYVGRAHACVMEPADSNIECLVGRGSPCGGSSLPVRSLLHLQ
eukprot:scaffold129844_cov24-Tisochrysis_lutea.AAC.1